MGQIEELEAKIRELESQVSSFSAQVKPFDEKILTLSKEHSSLAENASQQEAVLLEEVRAKIETIRREQTEKSNKLYQEQQALRQEKLAILRGLNQARDELERLERSKLELIQLLAARERLEKIETEFKALIEGAPFANAILDFQFEDVIFIFDAWRQGLNGVLNANDMGLGKTFETIAFIRAFKSDFFAKHERLPSILWLTKKTLIKTTHREIMLWDPEQRAIAFENKGDPDIRRRFIELAIQANAIIITNYESLNSNRSLMNLDWDLLVCDEVHKLRGGANVSGPTAIWKNVKTVAEKTQFMTFLTGSPINNHPREMWSYLNIFKPDKFPKLSSFEKEFCYGYGKGAKIDFDALIKVMAKQTIRRRKDEVKIQLPSKTREFRYIELEGCQRQIYNELRDKFFVWLDEQEGKMLSVTAVIAQLTYLRQIALYPGGVSVKQADGTSVDIDCEEAAKLTEAVELIEEIREENESEQIAVFSAQFNAPLYQLGKLLAEKGITSKLLTGENSNMVDELCEEFRQQKFDVFLINAKSGGEGLNLQKSQNWPGGACHAIFLDLWYNPMFNIQAEDRLHRKGQTDPVTIHTLQAEDSVDAFIASILEEKSAMIEGIMEAESLRPSDWKDKLEGLI